MVDPELTLSVPPDQTAFGVCDIITHVTESYFNGVDGTPLQDRFAESVIATALEWSARAVANGADLQRPGAAGISSGAKRLGAGRDRRDLPTIAAEVKHWHGAARDSWFAHLAIEVHPEKGPATWLEPVSDEDYDKLD